MAMPWYNGICETEKNFLRHQGGTDKECKVEVSTKDGKSAVSPVTFTAERRENSVKINMQCHFTDTAVYLWTISSSTDAFSIVIGNASKLKYTLSSKNQIIWDKFFDDGLTLTCQTLPSQRAQSVIIKGSQIALVDYGMEIVFPCTSKIPTNYTWKVDGKTAIDRTGEN